MLAMQKRAGVVENGITMAPTHQLPPKGNNSGSISGSGGSGGKAGLNCTPSSGGGSASNGVSANGEKSTHTAAGTPCLGSAVNTNGRTSRIPNASSSNITRKQVAKETTGILEPRVGVPAAASAAAETRVSHGGMATDPNGKPPAAKGREARGTGAHPSVGGGLGATRSGIPSAAKPAGARRSSIPRVGTPIPKLDDDNGCFMQNGPDSPPQQQQKDGAVINRPGTPRFGKNAPQRRSFREKGARASVVTSCPGSPIPRKARSTTNLTRGKIAPTSGLNVTNSPGIPRRAASTSTLHKSTDVSGNINIHLKSKRTDSFSGHLSKSEQCLSNGTGDAETGVGDLTIGEDGGGGGVKGEQGRKTSSLTIRSPSPSPNPSPSCSPARRPASRPSSLIRQIPSPMTPRRTLDRSPSPAVFDGNKTPAFNNTTAKSGSNATVCGSGVAVPKQTPSGSKSTAEDKSRVGSSPAGGRGSEDFTCYNNRAPTPTPKLDHTTHHGDTDILDPHHSDNGIHKMTTTTTTAKKFGSQQDANCNDVHDVENVPPIQNSVMSSSSSGSSLIVGDRLPSPVVKDPNFNNSESHLNLVNAQGGGGGDGGLQDRSPSPVFRSLDNPRAPSPCVAGGVGVGFDSSSGRWGSPATTPVPSSPRGCTSPAFGHQSNVYYGNCYQGNNGFPGHQHIPLLPHRSQQGSIILSDNPYSRPIVLDPDLGPMAEFLDQEDEDGDEMPDMDFHSGQEVQRISVITSLPELLQEHNTDCMKRVVPKVKEVLHVAQAEMQLAACSAFLQILEQDLVPLASYTQTFLQTILTCLDSRDPDVANAWLETLLDVIDLLPKEIIKKDILSVAIAKGQLSQSVQSRLSCCRILGKIATKFDPFVIKKEILPIVQSLCQDVDYEVRGCMCRQLDPVARGLGLDQTKSAILPELVELANDEESFVRLAGLETVVCILSLLDDETCTSTIVPLVCKFCQLALNDEDLTLPLVSKQLGKLCHSLSGNLAEDQRKWFVDYFRKLSKLGLNDGGKSSKGEATPPTPKSPSSEEFPAFPSEVEEQDRTVECRKFAAYNFPAMVLFAGVRHFKSDLASTLRLLVTDPCFHVRKMVANGFHEIVKLLSNNAIILHQEFINLLNDDSTEVLKGLIPNVPLILDLFTKCVTAAGLEAKNASLAEIGDALLGCEGVMFSSNNWRLQEEFLNILTCLPNSFSSEYIFYKYIPLLFKKLHFAKARPVKLAAARTLLLLMRSNHRLEQREDCCGRFVEEFGEGDSFHQRSLYIDVCKMVLQLYSRIFFKDYFFDTLLGLSSDQVPNIRLRLCPLLPELKALLKLPSDRIRLQALEQCVRAFLLNEKDRDVKAAIDIVVKEVDKVIVQMESGLARKSYQETDVLDQKKVEEEKMLLQIEERERKEEEAKQEKAKKKKDSTGSITSATNKSGKKGSKIPGSSKEKLSRERSGSIGSKENTLSREKSKTSRVELSAGKKLGSPSSTRKLAPNSANSTGSSRKGSAISMTSTGSATSTKSVRRSSIGTLPPNAASSLASTSSDSSVKRTGSQRKSTPSTSLNGSAISSISRKK